MEIRFAVIPADKQTNQRIGKLGKELGNKFPHRFLVDNKKYFPHATLFKVNVRKNKYSELAKFAKEFCGKLKTFDVQVDGFFMDEGCWLALKIRPTAKLTQLREQMHKEIKLSQLAKVKPLKPSFKPHFTLARFYGDDRPYRSVEGTKKQKYKVKVKVVGLCLSKQTQVYKILDKALLT